MLADTTLATPDPPLRATRPWRRTMLLRVASIILGLIAACLLLEAGMWVLDVQPARVITKRILLKRDADAKLRYDCYPSNPHGDFQPLPDTTQAPWSLFNSAMPPSELPFERLHETPWCVEYNSQNLVMRDRASTERPAPGVLRLAMLGDSFVFGEGVPADRTLPRQTQGLLGSRYEVLNLGASGWNTHKELTALEAYVPSRHARRAIVVFTANDVEVTPQLAKRQDFINDLVNVRDEHLLRHEAKSWYNVSSRLVRYVGNAWEMRRLRNETIQWYKDMYDPAHNQENLDKLAEDLSWMRARTVCDVVLVLYPLMEGLEGAYPLAEVHERVAAMAQSVGLPVFDLAPAFAGQRTEDLWVHESDHHPNSKAHAIAAKALVDWLHTVPGFLDTPASVLPTEHNTVTPPAAVAP